jgi:hypothetical protein
MQVFLPRSGLCIQLQFQIKPWDLGLKKQEEER